MTNEFSEISSEAFEAAKKALRAKKPLPSTLSEQFWKYFKEIAIQQYHFNRSNVEASILRSLTLDEVVRFFKVICFWALNWIKYSFTTLALLENFFFSSFSFYTYFFNTVTVYDMMFTLYYQDFIAPDNPCRRCISIHVLRDDDSSRNKKNSPSSMSQKNVVKIENMNYLIEDIDEFKGSLENFPTMQIKSLKKFRSKKRWC
jgi:hypothetical protein